MSHEVANIKCEADENCERIEAEMPQSVVECKPEMPRTYSMDDIVWHYTVRTKFEGIIRCKEIKTTSWFIGVDEKPAAWFSKHQSWEPSATKGIIFPDGLRRKATIEEMIERTGCLVRIAILKDRAGLVDWHDFKELSGIDPVIAKFHEDEASETMGDPKDWYASFKAVPWSDFLTIQVCENDAEGWKTLGT